MTDLLEETYHNQGIRYPSKHVEISLEDERKSREDTSEEVDRHEGYRNSFDFSQAINFDVLRAVISILTRITHRKHQAI